MFTDSSLSEKKPEVIEITSSPLESAAVDSPPSTTILQSSTPTSRASGNTSPTSGFPTDPGSEDYEATTETNPLNPPRTPPRVMSEVPSQAAAGMTTPVATKKFVHGIMLERNYPTESGTKKVTTVAELNELFTNEAHATRHYKKSKDVVRDPIVNPIPVRPYSIHELSELRDSTKTMEDKLDFPNTFRFVVVDVNEEESSQVFFGYEGKANNNTSIVAHGMLAALVVGSSYEEAYCKAAGAITLDGVGKIARINNTSGDFCTLFDSLAHVLGILIYNDSLAETVSLEYSMTNGQIRITYEIELALLQVWARQFYNRTEINAFQRQPTHTTEKLYRLHELSAPIEPVTPEDEAQKVLNLDESSESPPPFSSLTSIEVDTGLSSLRETPGTALPTHPSTPYRASHSRFQSRFHLGWGQDENRNPKPHLSDRDFSRGIIGTDSPKRGFSNPRVPLAPLAPLSSAGFFAPANEQPSAPKKARTRLGF